MLGECLKDMGRHRGGLFPFQRMCVQVLGDEDADGTLPGVVRGLEYGGGEAE